MQKAKGNSKQTKAAALKKSTRLKSSQLRVKNSVQKTSVFQFQGRLFVTLCAAEAAMLQTEFENERVQVRQFKLDPTFDSKEFHDVGVITSPARALVFLSKPQPRPWGSHGPSEGL